MDDNRYITGVLKKINTLIIVSIFTVVAGCSGGGGGSSPPPAQSTSLNGGGVKGPLANAAYELYEFDPTYVNFQALTAVATGRTNSQAAFQFNITTADLNPPYILVFTADGSTTDLMTGAAPIINRMKTVVTQAMLDSGKGLYATPLTSMAVDVAISNTLSNRAPYNLSDAYNNATTVKAKFLAALPIAALQVKSTLGFGLGDSVDIYTTPPMIDSDTTTNAEQTSTAQYRGAVEAFAAVVDQMKSQVSGTIANVSTETMVQALTDDLADGQIDGMDSDGNSINVLPVEVRTAMENIDPQQLIIPGTTTTVAQIETVLASETSQTGFTSVDTTELSDATIDTSTEPAQTNPDRDADGVLNTEDAFPDDPTESKDTDNDGSGNVADTDDDNDGIADTTDAFPLNAAESSDLDGDCGTITIQTTTSGTGCGDNSDADIDGDGVANASDAFPRNASAQNANDSDGDGWDDALYDNNVGTVDTPAPVDTDGDGIPDVDQSGAELDTDRDGDGVLNADDALPDDATETTDTDGDGTGNIADTDDDNDGTLDATDAFPLNAAETTDTDHDGVGNNADTDDDNDTVLDTAEAAGCELLRDCDGDGRMDNSDAFPADNTEWVDTDSDGTGNNADTDDDNDTVLDVDDAYPLDPTRSSLVTDTDGDGFGDSTDNCPNDSNPLQRDRDGDTIGDVCDPDIDGDGVANGSDAFPEDANESVDTDSDGLGNNGDPDDDNDGVVDTSDAFPLDSSEWLDTDGDATGNNADLDDDNDGLTDVEEIALGTNPLLADTDGDTVNDNTDNCALLANTDQLNFDLDAQGDACDADDDNDSVLDGADAFPLDATESVDTDLDGTGNNADTDDDNDGVLDTAEAAGCALLVDCDSDGVNDNADTFPTDPSETLDSDADGVGNNADVCPFNAATSTDASLCAFLDLGPVFESGLSWAEADTYYDGALMQDVTQFLYGTIQWNSTAGTTTDDEYRYDDPTTSWLLDTTPPNTMMFDTAGVAGWVAVADKMTVQSVSNTANTAVLVKQDGLGNIFEQLNITGVQLDIAGKPLVTFLDPQWQGRVSASVNFSATATAYGLSYTNAIDGYSIWCDQQDTTVTGDACGFVQTGFTTVPVAATALSNLVLSGATQNGLADTYFGIGNTQTGWVGVELVGSAVTPGSAGTTYFYENNGVSATPIGSTGTWVVNAVNGVNFLEFTIPADVAQMMEVDEEEKYRFFVEYDSGTGVYVRQGEKRVAGIGSPANGVMVLYGPNALTELKAAFGIGNGVVPMPNPDDSDNDGVIDSLDAYVDDPTRDADTDGDGTADEVYIVTENGVRTGLVNDTAGDTDDDGDGILDVSDTCPLFADATNNAAACDNSAVLGNHKLTSTVTALTDTSTGVLAGACFGTETVGMAQAEYLDFADAGSGRVLVKGDVYGVYNGLTNVLTVSNSEVREEWYQSLNGGSGAPLQVTQAFSATINVNSTAGTWSGSFTETSTGTDTASGSALNCVRTEDLVGQFAYNPTGSENYNGLYAMELMFHDNGMSQREAELVQFEVDAVNKTVTVHFMEEPNPDELVLAESQTSTFDPNTGVFELQFDGIYQRTEPDGMGGSINTVECESNKVRGLFVANPATTVAGDVTLWVDTKDHSRNFVGTTDPAVCTSGAMPDSEWSDDGRGYGQVVTSTGFSRTITLKSGGALQERIYLGLQNPPLIRSGANANLWLQVLDGATELCAAPFMSDMVNKGRYVIQNRLPDPDASLLAFQNGPYSLINCDTSDPSTGMERVLHGTSYTVRVLDTGTNGLKDTTAATLVGDDTELYTSSVTAEVSTNRFASVVSRTSIDVNGAKGSTTQTGGTISLFGYFNPNSILPVSWVDIADGQSKYQVRVEDSTGFVRKRMDTANGATTLLSMPAGVLRDWDKQTLRLTAVKTDGVGSIALAHSNKLELQAGLNGLINVETDHADPEAGVFQVYVQAGADGNVWNCVVTNRPFMCSGGMGSYLDLMTDTLNLQMTDDSFGTVSGTPSGSFTLTLQWTDSANANVSSYPGATAGVARVVNPELAVVSRVTNAGESTHVAMKNALPMYNQAVLSSATNVALDGAGATTWNLWNGDFGAVLDSFVQLPVDGAVAQKGNSYVTYNSLADGTLNLLPADDYSVTLSGALDGSANATYKVSYATPASVSEPAVLKADMLVNGAAVNTTTAAGPLIIAAASGVNVTWSTATTFPATTQWQLMFKILNDDPVDPAYLTYMPHAQIRTPKYTDGVGVALTVSATNDWALAAPMALPPGLYQLNIRSYDASNVEQGMGQKVFIQITP